MPTPRQTVQIPLAAGLSQRSDARASNPPALDTAKDVQFDELGGLQTRKPMAALAGSGAIFGGGTLSSCRKIAPYNDELLVFTDTALYSYNSQLSKWVSKGTHLAVKVDESTAFATTGDQVNADRAELSGTILYAWEDSSKVYVAAVDKTTGSVLMAPTAIVGYAVRPRLVALSTKILLFFHDNLGNLLAYALDPASPSTALSGASTTIVGGAASNYYYDAVRVASQDTAVVAVRLNPTTSYTVVSVTAALAKTSSTKARTCDGPIAVAVDPTGTYVQIVRGNGTNIQGDLLNASTLADVYTAQAVGTGTSTINQIAAAFRSTQDGGQYRCYAFWSSDEHADNTVAFFTQSNWTDTGNTQGTAANFVAWCGLGSRAFDYNGRIYLWLAFGQTSGLGSGGASTSSSGNYQNAYFLYRDDAFLCAKSVYDVGGGLASSTGRLPNVALTSGSTTFSWCATERLRINVGAGSASGTAVSDPTAYAMRSPRDVTFTFDSNAARRCVQLGNTLYIACGEGLLQYDGNELNEAGSHVYPWYFDALNIGGGNVANGVYGYKSTWRWQNAQGEVDRSTTATAANATMTGGPGYFTISATNLPITHKTSSAPAIEIWRTEVNPTADSPLYLITDPDPANTTNPNRYLSSATNTGYIPSFHDSMADSTATAKETFYENGSVLENLAPPACTIVIADESRLYLAGIAGDPNRIWYSKQRGDGEVAAFNDALTCTVPPDGGAITALAFLNETLIVFTERAVFMLPGNGYDNTGGGTNFGPARYLSTDVGAVNQEAVCVTNDGIIFKSNKGWYVLGKNLQVQYIGGPVTDYDSDTVYGIHLANAQQQVRILTSARMLVLDTLANQWGEWTIADGLGACIWSDTYTYLTSTGPKTEQTTYTSLTYGMDVETTWVKPNDLQGGGSIRRIMLLGEYRSACHLRIRVAYDYSGGNGGSYVDDQFWTVSPTTVGGPLQVKIGPSRQKCEAIKVRITAYATDNTSTPTGEAIKLTGLAFEMVPKQSLYKRLPVAQKV